MWVTERSMQTTHKEFFCDCFFLVKMVDGDRFFNPCRDNLFLGLGIDSLIPVGILNHKQISYVNNIKQQIFTIK